MAHDDKVENSVRDGAAPRFGPPTTANPLWRVVIVCGGLFCICCLMWMTAGIADQRSPVTRWLNTYGDVLVFGTGAGAIVSAFLAMLIDGHQTREMNRRTTEADQAPSDSDS